MSTDDLRARLSRVIRDAVHDHGNYIALTGTEADAAANAVLDLLAATDPAPDEALRADVGDLAESIEDYAPHLDYELASGIAGYLIASGYVLTAPTPPTVAPSDLPVATGYQPCSDECGGCPTCDPGLATGDAASAPDEFTPEGKDLVRRVEETEGLSIQIERGRPHPAPVHADDTDATLGAPDELSPSPKSAQTDTGAGAEGVRLTEEAFIERAERILKSGSLATVWALVVEPALTTVKGES